MIKCYICGKELDKNNSYSVEFTQLKSNMIINRKYLCPECELMLGRLIETLADSYQKEQKYIEVYEADETLRDAKEELKKLGDMLYPDLHFKSVLDDDFDLINYTPK